MGTPSTDVRMPSCTVPTLVHGQKRYIRYILKLI